MSTFVTLTPILCLSFPLQVLNGLFILQSSGFPNAIDAPGTKVTLLFESVVTYGQ